jgi:hypothetical protein
LIAARSGQSIAQANRRSSQTAHHNAQRNQTSAQLIFRTAQRNRSPVQIDRPSAQSNRLSGQTSLQIARCNYYLTQPNHPLFERIRLFGAVRSVPALPRLCHSRNSLFQSNASRKLFLFFRFKNINKCQHHRATDENAVCKQKKH